MKKNKLIERKFLGINVLFGGSAFPQVYAFYEEFYSDGSTRVFRGSSIRSVPTIEDCENESQSFRPELVATIEAAAALNRSLSNACLDLDSKLGTGEFRAY